MTPQIRANPSSLEKVSAERDALVRALKRAEEEIARARAAQKQAEARLAGSHAGRAPLVVQASEVGSHALVARAQAEQQRAETQVRTLEKQFQAQKTELDAWRAVSANLKAENQKLREQNEQVQKETQEDAPSAGKGAREELKSMRQELDTARAEIQRLRTLVVNAACGIKEGTTPAEIVAFPQTDPKSVAGSRQTASALSAKPSINVNTAPNPDAPWAA